MKKAILNLGLLSMMMMLTSFTSTSILSSDVHFENDQKGGQMIPPGDKTLSVATPTNDLTISLKSGQMMPFDNSTL